MNTMQATTLMNRPVRSSPSAEKLVDLAQCVFQTLPSAEGLSQLEINEAADAVTFHWGGAEFFARPSLQVLEKRGRNLYITQLSTSVQAMLMRNKIAGAVEALQQAEEMIFTRNQPRAGFSLLDAVKESLGKMIQN